MPLPEPLDRHRRRFAVAGGLVAWVAVLFQDALMGRGVFFERDVHAYWHPLISSFRRIVLGGSWPLWNPDVGFGAPLLADPNLQFAYPPTWATLWVPPAVYYTAFAVLHCLWTACGAYRLGRAWSLARLPAFLAAAAWSSSGPFLSSVSLFHHYAGASWIPWVLWALERAVAAPGRRTSCLLGLAIGGQLLAGSADMFVFTALAGAGRLLSLVVRSGQPRAVVGRLWAVLGRGAVLAFLLSAVQWIPASALLQSATRPGQGLRTTTYWSLHPASLADLFVPYLVNGLPWGAGPRRDLFEGREPLLACLYAGVGMAALAGLGLLAPGAARPRRLLLLAALFLVAALGRFTPFQYLLAIPPLGLLRYPVKYAVPAALLFAVLAGFGLQAWVAEWPPILRRRVRFLSLGLLTFAMLCAGTAAWLAQPPAPVVRLLDPGALGGGPGPALAASVLRLARAGVVALAVWFLVWRRSRGPRSPRWMTATLVGLVCADVAAVGRHVNPLAPASLLDRRPAVVEGLGPGERVYSDPHSLPALEAQLAHVPAGWEPSWARAFGFRQRLGAPTGALWQLRGSYDGAFTGLAPGSLSYLSTTVAKYTDQPIGIKLLRLGAVRAVVTMRALPGLGAHASHPSVFASPVRRYAVPDPLPSAYWVGRAHVSPEPFSYAVLSDPAFDPSREILLATGQDVPEGAGTQGRVVPLESKTDRLVFQTSADGPGFLVVVEAFDSGWRATVDGRPAPVRRANVLFRAVAVPGGEHRVELRYRPPSVAWGLALSVLGVLAAAVAWRRKARGEGGDDSIVAEPAP